MFMYLLFVWLMDLLSLGFSALLDGSFALWIRMCLFRMVLNCMAASCLLPALEYMTSVRSYLLGRVVMVVF